MKFNLEIMKQLSNFFNYFQRVLNYKIDGNSNAVTAGYAFIPTQKEFDGHGMII